MLIATTTIFNVLKSLRFKAILGASAFCVLLAFSLSVHLSFVFPTRESHFLIWITFVFSGALLGLAVTPWCRHGYILPSAMLMPFFSSVVCLALSCKPDGRSSEESRALMLTGVVGMGGSLLAAERNPDLLMGKPEEDEEKEFLMSGTDAAIDPFETDSLDEEEEGT